MTAQIRLLLIPGSQRHGSTNAAVLRTAERLAPPGVTTAVLDRLSALPQFNPDDDFDPLDRALPAVHERRREAGVHARRAGIEHPPHRARLRQPPVEATRENLAPSPGCTCAGHQRTTDHDAYAARDALSHPEAEIWSSRARAASAAYSAGDRPTTSRKSRMKCLSTPSPTPT